MKDKIYVAICSDTTINEHIAKANFANEFEVLSYGPWKVERSLLKIVRQIHEWARESNSEAKLHRRVVPKDIVHILINSENGFEKVCIGTYSFFYNGPLERLKGRYIWYAIYMYSI